MQTQYFKRMKEWQKLILLLYIFFYTASSMTIKWENLQKSIFFNHQCFFVEIFYQIYFSVKKNTYPKNNGKNVESNGLLTI